MAGDWEAVCGVAGRSEAVCTVAVHRGRALGDCLRRGGLAGRLEAVCDMTGRQAACGVARHLKTDCAVGRALDC